MTNHDSEVGEFVEKIQDHLNHYIDVADRKASILLTGQIAFLGLFGNLVRPLLGNASSIDLILMGLTLILTLLSGALSLSVVYPRTPETPAGYMLWTSILKMEKSEYRREISNLDTDEIQTEMIDENYALARVADKKYQYLRYSLISTVALAIMSILSVVIIS